MSPQERARAAHAAAEAATHPRDKAAFKAAAYAWERLASPGVPWSYAPARRTLTDLKRAVALATGPFTQPQPPKTAPIPANPREGAIERLRERVESGTIQF